MGDPSTRVPTGAARGRLRRGWQRSDRIPLGRGSKRATVGVSNRSAPPPGGRACRARHTCSIGGNVTGVVTLNVEIPPKRLELLHELFPTATNFALLVNPTNPAVAERVSKDV